MSKVQEKDIGFEMQCKIVFCTVDIFAVLQIIKLCRILTFVIPEEICDKGKCTHWLNLLCTVGGFRNISIKFLYVRACRKYSFNNNKTFRSLFKYYGLYHQI